VEPRNPVKTPGKPPSSSYTKDEEVELELIVSVEHMPDERLTHFYQSIRQQAEADRTNKHRFTAGTNVREYADRLRNEMIKRRLRHTPIEWPSSPWAAAKGDRMLRLKKIADAMRMSADALEGYCKEGNGPPSTETAKLIEELRELAREILTSQEFLNSKIRL
jgi:hypothetical protein